MSISPTELPEPPKKATKRGKTSDRGEPGRKAEPEGEKPKERFNPDVLDKMVIALPLMELMRKDTGEQTYDVIIDLNLDHPGGRNGARAEVETLIKETTAGDSAQGIKRAISQRSQQYLFARLSKDSLETLVRQDNERNDKIVCTHRAIFRIWPDFAVEAFINKSISTVKADAARSAFSAMGETIVWAVVDSGIAANHPHFIRHQNLITEPPLQSMDFTALGDGEDKANQDDYGHGTHVAGIIAGETFASDDLQLVGISRQRDETGTVHGDISNLEHMSGMAPKCKLLSLKVLDERGKGKTSGIIAALEYIQEINGYGRRLRIHGVNLSVGYDFEPKWFACGQSPLCVEVDRLVRSGVVVVVASGNTGYGGFALTTRETVSAGMDVTINDPGNAELAITVGSTHRDMPHVYGVSFFSSKGPTGDGRAKPDLVAPGEKILSCAAGRKLELAEANETGLDPEKTAFYVEDSGTSMAAPHVSGVIAAFLSVRREFIGQPEKVKEIFLNSATDLKRNSYFQGHGLVDLMRSIQSV
ncbi:MAG: S8 family peptidase [Cyanobium sp.]